MQRDKGLIFCFRKGQEEKKTWQNNKSKKGLHFCSASAIWLGGFRIICHTGFSSPAVENCTYEMEGKYKVLTAFRRFQLIEFTENFSTQHFFFWKMPAPSGGGSVPTNNSFQQRQLEGAGGRRGQAPASAWHNGVCTPWPYRAKKFCVGSLIIALLSANN